jgi:hypothetical protein
MIAYAMVTLYDEPQRYDARRILAWQNAVADRGNDRPSEHRILRGAFWTVAQVDSGRPRDDPKGGDRLYAIRPP